jgi:hypothetical protein
MTKLIDARKAVMKYNHSAFTLENQLSDEILAATMAHNFDDVEWIPEIYWISTRQEVHA